MSGIVINATGSWTSSSLYYYDVSSGGVALLSGGESGDVYTAWLNDQLYVFNRGAGRVSYSTLKPRLGVRSRSVEKSIPGVDTFDPSFATTTFEGDLILSLNSKGSVVIANSETNDVIQEIRGIDKTKPEQRFRPDHILLSNTQFFVAHQALDDSYGPNGSGVMFVGNKTSTGWNLDEQISISLTNPGYMKFISEDQILVTGVCYSSENCQHGVELIDVTRKISRHLSSWDSEKWMANGGFYPDIKDGSLLACVAHLNGNSAKNILGRYDIETGNITTLRELSGPGCGGIITDAAQKRIIVGEPTSLGGGVITVLSEDGTVLGQAQVEIPIQGMTATFD
jgi:hypothetical protein